MKHRQALDLKKNPHRLVIISLTYTIPFTDQIASLDVHIDDSIIIGENVESNFIVKVRKMAKSGINTIKYMYHTWPRIPHGKVTEPQLGIKSKSQEVSSFPACDHKAAMN